MNKKSIMAALGREPADLVLKHGKTINVFTEEIIESDVAVSGGKIVGLGDYEGIREIDCSGKFISPGLIDAHIHLESSLLIPEEFSKVLIGAGTTSVIADPHEAVNVSGTYALDWLLKAADNSLTDIYYMLPSSVPAADTETNGGGNFSAEDMKKYTDCSRIIGLGEAMRFPDVICGEQRMAEKIDLFSGRKIDGHAPGMTGRDLQAYRYAGVDSDHECTEAQEAVEKLRAGFALLVREGSGAKNLDPLIRGLLAAEVPLDRVLFCTDDKHTADIQSEGHINACIRKAIRLGVPAAQAYRMGTLNTAAHYRLNGKGALAPGYDADLLIIDDLEQVLPAAVIKSGRIITPELLFRSAAEPVPDSLKDTVVFEDKIADDIAVKADALNDVIVMTGDSLTTLHSKESVSSANGCFRPDSTCNKLCVIERYGKTGEASAAPIRGFGIHCGAVATTVAHDSHNVIAAGDNDNDILLAVNTVKKIHGGYVIASGGQVKACLPLPVCGLMSDRPCREVTEKAAAMQETAHSMGIPDDIDPFTTLSFMALTVIPELRLTERGLFDVDAMAYI